MNRDEARDAAADLIRASREMPQAPPLPVEEDPFEGIDPDELVRRANPEAFRETIHRMIGQTGRGHAVFRAQEVELVYSDEDLDELAGAWVPIRVYITATEAVRYGQPERDVWPS